MFKDGSFFLILIQSGNMLHFPGYISSSRQNLDNLFTPFERNYVGVVFDIKISIMCFQESSSKMPKIRLFLRRLLRRHGLEGW